MVYKAIVIGGNIAAGKSTVAPLVAERLNACLIKEPVESWRKSGRLQDFYSGKLSAFEFQMYALETRSSALNVQLCKSSSNGETPKMLVLDRWLDDDLAFAIVNHRMGKISHEEMKLYKERWEQIANEFRQHLDIRVVWMGTTPNECMKRIKERGREEESGITIAYLRALHEQRPAPDFLVGSKLTVEESTEQITRFATIAWGMTAIVAVSINGVIGRDDKLPWYEPDDLDFFTNYIKGATVVVGRKTYESIPKQVFEITKNKVIVISRDPEKGITFDHFLETTKIGPNIFIIGGADIYRQAFERGVVSRVIQSTIPKVIEKGDAFFSLPEEFSKKYLSIEFFIKPYPTSSS